MAGNSFVPKTTLTMSAEKFTNDKYLFEVKNEGDNNAFFSKIAELQRKAKQTRESLAKEETLSEQQRLSILQKQ